MERACVEHGRVQLQCETGHNACRSTSHDWPEYQTQQNSSPQRLLHRPIRNDGSIGKSDEMQRTLEQQGACVWNMVKLREPGGVKWKAPLCKNTQRYSVNYVGSWGNVASIGKWDKMQGGYQSQKNGMHMCGTLSSAVETGHNTFQSTSHHWVAYQIQQNPSLQLYYIDPSKMMVA